MFMQPTGAIDLSDLDVNGLTRGELLSALFDAALAVAGEADFADPLAGCGRFVGFASDDGDGHWITIGGSKDENGKRHGGSPVFIKDGRIVKGAPSLTGKKIDALKEDASDLGSHRAQLKSSREYARAVWGKEGRKAGHDPKHLHQLAAEMLAHDAARVEDHTKAVQSARKTIESYGGDWRTIAIQRSKGGDASRTKGIDVAADMLARQYPHLFPNQETEHNTDRLFDMLGSNPTGMSEDGAYLEAMDELRRYGPTVEEKHYKGGRGRKGPKAAPAYQDDVPFAWVADEWSAGASVGTSAPGVRPTVPRRRRWPCTCRGSARPSCTPCAGSWGWGRPGLARSHWSPGWPADCGRRDVDLRAATS